MTEVYDKLKHCSPHMTVYLKEEIPDRFHYQHNDRIQPIILVADEGWTIVLNKSSLKCKYLFCTQGCTTHGNLGLEGGNSDSAMFIRFSLQR